MIASKFTATVAPKGSKFLHSVFDGDELIDTRTSAHRYGYVLFVDFGEGAVPVRYTRAPKPIGAGAGERGWIVAACVEIEAA